MGVRGRTIRQSSGSPPPIGGYHPADWRSLVLTRRSGATGRAVLFSHLAGVDPTVAGWARGGRA
ncbi:hypothetical protein GCM10010344_17900 [Streptomyces bluensis]|nr:hypothetical protein GCM10010344_17900 [Streptomyces bluensis]